MSASSPLDKDDPIMVAWELYRSDDSDDGYRNAARWITVAQQYTEGSIWGAFLAGYKAGRAESQRNGEDDQ